MNGVVEVRTPFMTLSALLACSVLATAGVTGALVHGRTPVERLFSALYAAVVVVLAVRWFWVVLRIDTTGVTIRNVVRTRHFDWIQIDEVSVGEPWWTKSNARVLCFRPKLSKRRYAATGTACGHVRWPERRWQEMLADIEPILREHGLVVPDRPPTGRGRASPT